MIIQIESTIQEKPGEKLNLRVMINFEYAIILFLGVINVKIMHLDNLNLTIINKHQN